MKNLASFKLIWVVIAFVTLLDTGTGYVERNHGPVSVVENVMFTESDREILNPNRGFYGIYRFMPSDETDNLGDSARKLTRQDSNMLAMIQINLRNYADGLISDNGLKDIEDIFAALRELNKQYIVRFVYDWDGKNTETEPENVEIILNHMKQLEYILKENADIIFVLQGLFIGNWGEMHGTKHLSSMNELAACLSKVTDDRTYLAVRTPAQWRTLNGGMVPIHRFSLYNDGIMGSESDYGTYGTKSKLEAGMYSAWKRSEELLFQEKLCETVPNGGEVIVDNPFNDFENALASLKTMHITYLNRDYDKAVLNKWADSVITEDSVFFGMDGLTYVERHLGYRLLIAFATFDYEYFKDEMSIEIGLKNIGFAPIYREPEKVLIVRNKATGEVKTYILDERISTLSGGNNSHEILTMNPRISLTDFAAGEYEVYFYIKDTAGGCFVELANEQGITELGYMLGSFRIEERKGLIKIIEEEGGAH